MAKKVVHKLNAYTWAGRRAECALTSEWLSDTEDWNRATCPECLALRAYSDLIEVTR